MRIPCLIPVVAIGFITAGALAQESDFGPSLGLVEAVGSAVRRHPARLIQEQQVAVSDALRRQATAAFDNVLGAGLNQSRTDIPLVQGEQGPRSAIGSAVTNLTDLSLSSSMLLRNGISMGPSVEIGRTVDNRASLLGVNSSRIGLQLTIPLLRGRGLDSAAAAREKIAIIEADAAGIDLRQIVAALALNATSAYWSWVTANKRLEIAAGSEERGRMIVDNIQTLIDADQSPRNDIHNVAANLADRRSTRLAAEQAAIRTRQQLSLNMGAGVDELLRTAHPRDDLPLPAAEIPPDARDPEVKFYVEQAFQRRSDLRAAQRRIEESTVSASAAKNTLLPQVDLNFAAGYYGLAEGRAGYQYLHAPFSGVKGPSVGGSVTYQFTQGNRAAKARVSQAAAQLRQAELQSADLRRQVASSVISSLEAIRHASLGWQAATQSVAEYREALAGEREKLKLGTGSVVIMLTVEDRLTNTLLSEVQSRLEYAVAIAQFRFATGTLVSGPDGAANVTVRELSTFPFAVTESKPGERR